MPNIHRMKILPTLAAMLVIVSVVPLVHATPDEVPDKVLFVGNSFTFYNNGLHTHYRGLLRSARPDDASRGRVRIMTMSGARLPEHRAALAAQLKNEKWDVVILQGHSRGPIEEETAAAFRDAAREFAGDIRAHGAEPVFFMTWAYDGVPEMTGALDRAYSEIASEVGARVAPVGLAFERAARERPDIALHAADRQHPSLAGSYLASCVFFAMLQGTSPEGIEYFGGLAPEVARFLQQVAWQTVASEPRPDRDS